MVALARERLKSFPLGETVKIGSSEPILTDEGCGKAYENPCVAANSYCGNTSSVSLRLPPSPQGEGLAAAPLNDNLPKKERIPMKIGNIEVNNPVFLGPMAGVTDWAYRTTCARLGAGVTVTEMVSSRALVYQDKKSVKLLRKNKGSLCGAQIFGNDPQIMAQAAVLALEHSGADFIDINMGCPMPKIAQSGDGCGLMRTPELAGDIVAAVKKAVDVPVTIKCRLGWDKGSINVLDFTRRMEDNGADLVTVHGRTRAMLYSGKADWDTIRKVKEQLSIPVIANGDIVDGATALRCLKWTGADGIMIGRAVFGDPWVFEEVQYALRGEEYPGRPALKERIAVAVEQFKMAEQDHGEKIACLEARKHFAWYLKGVRNASYYKKEITSLTTMEDIYRVARDVVRDLE